MHRRARARPPATLAAIVERPMTVHRYRHTLAQRQAGYGNGDPLCGQRNAAGTGRPRTRFTDDPAAVTCAKCRRAIERLAAR